MSKNSNTGAYKRNVSPVIFLLKVMALYSENDRLQRSFIGKFFLTCSLFVTVCAGRLISVLLQ